MSGDSVSMKFGGDPNDLVRAMERVAAGQDRMYRKVLQTTKASQAASSEGKKHNTMLSQMGRSVLTAAAGYVSFASAIGLAKKAMRELTEEGRRASQSLEQAVPGRKKLVQVSGGDPAEFNRLVGLSQGIQTTYGMGEDPATDLVFAAKSATQLANLGMIAKTSKFGDPAAMLTAVSKVQGAFGKGEGGTGRQILNKVIKAAERSEVSIQDFAPQLATFAATAARVGFSDESAMAALSQLTFATKSPEIAGTQLRAFLSTADREGFIGKDFSDTLRRFDKLPEKERARIIGGRKEFSEARQLLMTNETGIKSVLGEVIAAQRASGTDASPMAGLLRVAEGDVGLTSTMKAQAAERALALIEEKEFGPAQMARNEARSRNIGENILRGEFPVNRAARRWASGGAVNLPFMSPEGVAAVGDFAADPPNPWEGVRQVVAGEMRILLDALNIGQGGGRGMESNTRAIQDNTRSRTIFGDVRE